MSKQLAQGAGFLYIETMLSLVSGYIFWIVISKIVSSEVVGVSSTVVSLATIFSTIATIGIPSGIPRFLGKSFSDQRLEDARKYIVVSLVWTSVGIAACIVSLVVLHSWIEQTFRISFNLILVAILLVSSTGISTLFRAIIISSLKTMILPLTMAISTSLKFVLAVVLALAGFGSLGVTIGFTLYSVIASFILAFVLAKGLIINKHQETKSEINFSQSSRSILASSMANWVPTMIYTIGAHLGTVTVFGSQGASEAGVYFMAFSIVLAISAVTQVLFTIAYPALSGMSDGRKRFAWQIIKMSLMIALPLSSALMFYSKDIMSLFGKGYASGGSSLSILLLSTLPISIATGISTLAYAYGNYKQVLMIGIASNLPRALLYFVLLPIFGSIGASMSYTMGSILGLAISLVMARKLRMILVWKDIAMIMLVSSGIGFVLSYLKVNYIAGTIVTVIASYFLFLQLQLLTRSDLHGIMGFLPNRLSNKIIMVIDSMGKLRRLG